MFSALKKFLGGAEKKEILAPVSGKCDSYEPGGRSYIQPGDFGKRCSSDPVRRTDRSSGIRRGCGDV